MQEMTTAALHFKGMLYGSSGVGKSVLAQLLAQKLTPPDKDIIFVDSGEGWVSLLNHKNFTKRTIRIEFQNMAQLERLASAIEKGYGRFANVGAVVLDEYSSMATSDLDAVTKRRAALDETGVKDPDTPAQPDYNTSSHRSRKVATAFAGLPIHVIFTAHEREDKSNNGLVKYRPSFTPALGKDIRGLLHLVGYMSTTVKIKKDANGSELREETRTIQVHPTVKIDAKSRVGGLDTVTTYEELIPVLKEWLKGAVPESPDELVSTKIIDQDTGGFPPETDES